MKKSFMTRVLATGLSLAMAFSMAAATNVSVASAAATPAMKSSKWTVNVGQTKNYNATASTKKNFTITKVRMSAAGDTKADYDWTASKVTVTGKAATKGSNVAIYFKNKSTKKTKKVTTKLVVKDNKTTMTAAATKVKEITLTFDKAVKDTAAVTIALKKGNSTPTFTAKWADDAKSVVLAMDSRLTAGTYDVTVSGINAEALTASIPVENQKLAAFKLATNYLIAKYDSVSEATIAFKAVDQYGERVSGVDANVTVTLGSAGSTPYATYTNKDTTVTVTGIPTVLAVAGQTGKITIVDSKTGVSLVEDITYQPASKAVKAEAVGLYDANNKKVESVTAGTNTNGYKVAFKFTDQYDLAMSADAVKDIQASVIAGTTGVAAKNSNNQLEKVTIGGTDYMACTLKDGKFAAGTFQITLVNTKYGLLGTTSYDVAPGTVIKSFSVSADSDVFEGEDAELSYTAIDADGKEVKDYNTLKAALVDSEGMDATKLSLKKQADGSAKLVYKPVALSASAKNPSYTGFTTDVLTFQLYKGTVNTVVVNATVRVNQARVFWEVVGVDTSKTIAGVSGTALTYKAENLKIADQYGNTLTGAKINSLIKSANKVSVAAIENKNNWAVTSGALTGKDDVFGAVVGTTGAVKFKVQSAVNTKDAGFEMTLSNVDAKKAADFAIEWKNGSTFDISTASKTLVKGVDFKVSGTVDGKKVEIPTDQYEILDGASISKVDRDNGKNIVTKEGTLKVVVTDSEHKANIITATYTYSNDYAKITKIAVKGTKTKLVSSAAMNLSAIVDAAFEVKDQYGVVVTSYPTSLVADVVVIGGEANVDYNGTGKVVITTKAGKELTEVSVTLTCGDLTATTTIGVE